MVPPKGSRLLEKENDELACGDFKSREAIFFLAPVDSVNPTKQLPPDNTAVCTCDTDGDCNLLMVRTTGTAKSGPLNDSTRVD